jgi:predicted MFS family arabinose efflux permease
MAGGAVRGVTRGSAIATAIAGLVALAVAIGVGRFAFTPILPMMQDDAGVSIVAGGWLASANYVGYLVGALSVLGLRLRAPVAIRLGLVTIGITTVGMGLGKDFAVWLLLRTIAGVASAWVLIYVSAWCLERLAPVGRPLLNSMVFTGVGAGITLAGALCLALMHARTGSARTWIVFGLLSLVLSLAIWPVFTSADHAHSEDAGRAPSRGLVWNGETIRLILCYGAFGFGYIIPATFLPVMARQVIQDPLVFGWSWPIFGAAAMISTLGTGLLARLITYRRLWLIGDFVMAFGVGLPVVWPGIAATMLAALAVGGTFMVITMAGMQEAREVAGVRATGLMAAMTSAFGLGQIAGPIVVSYVVGTGRQVSASLLIACGVLVAGGLALPRRDGVRIARGHP